MKSRSEIGMTGRGGTMCGGFTLIEIIVVITIIAILTSLGLMVGHHVRQNAQAQATRSLILSLDQAVTAVESEKGSKIPGIWRDDLGNEFAVVDGWGISGITEPSQGLLLLATGQHPSLKETILRADSRYVSNVALQSGQTAFPGPATAAAIKVPVLKDAWGNPIRFVHPRFDGGWGDYLSQASSPSTMSTRPNLTFAAKLAGGAAENPPREFVRSYRTAGGTGSADEGLCTGGRGYFYSAGADKDPGTRDDNVYLDAPPKFPSETASFH